MEFCPTLRYLGVSTGGGGGGGGKNRQDIQTVIMMMVVEVVIVVDGGPTTEAARSLAIEAVHTTIINMKKHEEECEERGRGKRKSLTRDILRSLPKCLTN